MNNIHIIVSDEPSKIGRFIDSRELILRSGKDIPRVEAVNIYITSEEEIKDVRPHKGKWQLEKGEILNKFLNYFIRLSSK